MSDKPLSERLQLKPGRTFRVVNPPPEHAGLLGRLPDGVTELAGTEPVDVLLVYLTSRAQMEAQLEGLKQQLNPKGILWVAYTKGTSSRKGDINRDSIFAYGQTIGLSPVSMTSISEDWSGFRLKVL